jgi:predicted transcriptional regulator
MTAKTALKSKAGSAVAVHTDGLKGMKSRSLRIAKAMDAGKRVRKGGSVTFEGPIEMARVFTVGRLQVYRAVKTQPLALPLLAKKLRRDSSAVAKDVKTLERYGILRTKLKPNPGHGKVKIVEATAPSLRFVTTI